MHTPLSLYLRYVNYLAAAQLYLRDNFLLREELKVEHIKDRILGHWGTVPGLNFMYAHVSALIARVTSNESRVTSELNSPPATHNTSHSFLFIAGPGHGAPAILANLFAEGTLEKYYPELRVDAEGIGRLLHMFSWPGGFPSHSNPGTPGAILEGGELGYSLATAYGSVMDNPDLIAVCAVGDGEAETGPLATAWQSIKFLNPAESGAVLPILHINGYKITGPTIFGVMSNEEITQYFTGLGYEPMIVDIMDGDEEEADEKMAAVLDFAFAKIREIQYGARSAIQTPPAPSRGLMGPPHWPVIILRSLKGWSGVKTLKGKKVEGTQRSHGIPLQNPKTDPVEFEALKNWLESYAIGELVDADGRPLPEVLSILPSSEKRMGQNPHTIGGNLRRPLLLPAISNFQFPISNQTEEKSRSNASSTTILSHYLRDVFRLNEEAKNFRFFCPDETESNKFSSLFEATDRAFMWPVQEWDEHNSPTGRVMEMLSEHTLQGWLQGYLLTGRHGIFVTYEAFAMITASMVDQYAKFLKQSRKYDWRKPISSLNYLLTSVGWRQEHNGYSHQNPSFIANVLEKHGNLASIYFPCDANSLLVIMEDCLKRTNSINVIVANKADLPQWVSIEQAREELKTGLGIWEVEVTGDKLQVIGKIPNTKHQTPNTFPDPDIVFAAAGDIFVNESIAAIRILKKAFPEIKTRFVNVSELTSLGMGDEKSPLDDGHENRFSHYFTADKPVVFSFHGYPSTIKQLLYDHQCHDRFSIHGYLEEGTTTTPFDMLVLNKTSRYHLVIDAVERLMQRGVINLQQGQKLIDDSNAVLQKHHEYIREFGKDMEGIS